MCNRSLITLFLILGIALWQITLVYNADLGPHNFNPGNILLLIAYASIVIVSFYIVLKSNTILIIE